MEKICVDGKIMWQSSNGERVNYPGEKIDTYGMTKIDVDGRIMWERCDGVRILNPYNGHVEEDK